jgi:phage shock protein C
MSGIAFAVAVIVAVLVAAHIKGKGVRRSNDNVLAGVCSGVAKHYGWDVTAVRIIWFVLAVTMAGPVLAYILLWIMLPSE